MIDTTYHSTTFSPTVNLLPFYFGEDCSITTLCVEGIIENIALTIPFGFGINFLVRVKPRDFLWLPIAVGLGIELSQLAISLAFRSGFRAIDINDAILNATGVYIGYALFMAFGWLYSRIVDRYKLKDKRFFADVYDIVLQTPAIGKSKSA